MKQALAGVTIVALFFVGQVGAAGHGKMAGDCEGPGMKPQGMQHGKKGGCGHGKHGKHGKHGGKGHGHAMRHANPMPNLMKIIKKHGDQLDLSDDQAAKLKAWRENNMAPMHARADKVMALEAELKQAALDGKPKAELMGIASRIMTERTQIIATKAACRDNLMSVLTPQQFEKVVSLQGN